VYFAIVYGKGLTNEVWSDCASPSPSFNDGTVIIAQSRDFLRELWINEWTFLK
jgi:hypothetical protein